MARINLIRVTADNFDVLHRLMQLYLYDFSVYFCDEDDGHVDEEGLFDPSFDLMRYVGTHDYWGYLARADERWAGFSLVSTRSDKARSKRRGRNVDEFFVLRCFRRQGIGQEIARQTFDTYRGFWQVMQVEENEPAKAFWRAAIASYTDGRYHEFQDTGPGEQQQLWQTFDSSRWG